MDLPPTPDMIEITVNVTIHRPVPGRFDRRVDTIAGMPCAFGPDEIDVLPPGTPFLIEHDEGLAMIAKFGGRVITRPETKDK